MSTLQKRFDGGDLDIPDIEEGGDATVKTEDVKMEGDDTSTPAAAGETAERSDTTKPSEVAPAAAKTGGRMKFKLAPKREKPKLDDDGEEINEENGEGENDDDDALSSVASDGSEYAGE